MSGPHPRVRDLAACLTGVWLGVLPAAAWAQTAPPAESAPASARVPAVPVPSPPEFVIDGPPPPAEENGMTRDPATGKATVRAIRLGGRPLHVDGTLDEAVYSEHKPFGGLLQVVPRYGEPATEQTDIWVMFDERAIYVAARCYDSAPPSAWVANELRRDTNQLRQNDHFGVAFDTFYDRRSGFMFYANPLGARGDYSTVDEGQPNTDWNPVWEARTGRFDGGWTVEMEIPFKSLRYRSGTNQVWGLQFRRSIRRKNEWDYWTPVPQQMGGPQALGRVSAFGTLVGLDLPAASTNIELKPFALGKLTTDRVRVPAVTRDGESQVGGDVKYSVTANLTADVTVNTDFAQVEIDEQQVNLTRFTLFLPEKRDFFLEGRGVYDFGRGGIGGGFGGGGFGGGGFGGGGFGGGTDTPSLFYSRRIGLNRGRVIPIDVGGRLTGKIGRYAVGLLNIQAREEAVSATPATNFTVVRVKRDILRRSTVGVMFTNRSRSLSAPGGSNQAYGVDAQFGFYQNVGFGGYYARTATTGATGDSESYQARFEYPADRYGFSAQYLKVGEAFSPEVGFLRRSDFRRSFVSARFSPRPVKRFKAVRKFTYDASLEYIENGAGRLESRQQTGRVNIEFDSSDFLGFEANASYDRLPAPFSPSSGVTIPTGGYRYNDVQISYSMGQQRRVSGFVSVNLGQYYNGTIRAVSLGNGRVSITKQLSVEPRVSINRVALPAGRFTSRLYSARADYSFSPRMFASSLLQYNSGDRTFNSNVRFRWEYRPGSEFFVVWTDEHDTTPRAPGLALRNRAFVVKLTRLLRF